MNIIARMVQTSEIKGRKTSTSCEKLHAKLATVENISFTDFHKTAEFGYGLPAIMQEVASQRIENHIDTSTRGLLKDIG